MSVPPEFLNPKETKESQEKKAANPADHVTTRDNPWKGPQHDHATPSKDSATDVYSKEIPDPYKKASQTGDKAGKPFDFDENTKTATVDHGPGRGKQTVHLGSDGKPDEVHTADGQIWKKHIDKKTNQPDGTWDRWKPGQDPEKTPPFNSKMEDVKYDKTTGVLSWVNLIQKDGKDVEENRAIAPGGKYYKDTTVEGPPKAEETKPGEKKEDGKTQGDQTGDAKKDDTKKADAPAKESEVIDKAAKDHKLTDAQKQQVLEGIHSVKEGSAEDMKKLGKMDKETLEALKDVLTTPPNNYKVSAQSTSESTAELTPNLKYQKHHSVIVIVPPGSNEGIRVMNDSSSSSGPGDSQVEAVKTVDSPDGPKVVQGTVSGDSKKVEEQINKIHDAAKKPWPSETYREERIGDITVYHNSSEESKMNYPGGEAKFHSGKLPEIMGADGKPLACEEDPSNKSNVFRYKDSTGKVVAKIEGMPPTMTLPDGTKVKLNGKREPVTIVDKNGKETQVTGILMTKDH
jgi:hypothetical protein